jgi:hypothetical protein
MPPAAGLLLSIVLKRIGGLAEFIIGRIRASRWLDPPAILRAYSTIA